MALSRRKKIIIGAIAAVLLTAIIIISVFASRKDVPEATMVKLETRQELRSNVTASGEIRPIQYINLTSEVQGRIEEIYVKEGDQVTIGQPLVRLDPNQLQYNTDAQYSALQAAQNDAQVSRSQVIAAQNQLSQAQQGMNASEASLSTAQLQVSTAREAVNQARQQIVSAQVEYNAAIRERKRLAELVESGVASKQEFDQADDRVSNAKARLDAQDIAVKEAESRVKEAVARVNEARARVNQQAVSVRDGHRSVQTATLTSVSSQKRADQQSSVFRGQRNQRDKTMQVAPINGVIADIPSKVGTFAVAGLSTTPLMTIADMSTVNVEVKVDETEIDKVAVGQIAKVKVDAFGDKEITGEVTQKNPLAQGKSQTTGGLSTNINVQEAKEFKVVIQLKEVPDDIRNGLRPGMSATATINTKTVENVIAVPLQALVEKQPDASPSPTIQGNVPSPADKPKPAKGVYILDGNKAKFVEVTTGITGESDIEITSGLSAGQEVLTGPSRVLKTLKDGDVVKRQTKKEGADNSNRS